MRFQKVCKNCEKVFSTRISTKIYCCKFCKNRFELSKNSIRDKSAAAGGLRLGKVGDISELEVSAHYLREGWEVFRNVSCNGPADIVIWKPDTGEIKLIDIKSLGKKINESIFRSYSSKSHKKVDIIMYEYPTKILVESISDLDS